MTRLLAAAFLALYASAASALEQRTELPATTTPGALIIGRTEPTATVRFAERTLRIADDGSFVFGIGRDVSGSTRIDVAYRDGTRESIEIPVKPREFAIEQVNGLPESTVNPDQQLAQRIAREQVLVAEARVRDDARQDYRFGFIWPNKGRISGVYGSQRILNGTPKNPHYGVDIAVGTGTPIHAPAGGIISFVGEDLVLTGGTVLIDHGHGLSSVFVHMSRIDVKPEQRIEQGQVIGAVGATGRATGPHLHWGMNWFDTRLDPQLVVGPMPK